LLRIKPTYLEITLETRNSAPTPAQNSSRGADHDIFQDPALTQTIQDDPLFLFLKKWWLHVAVVAGAIVLGIYAKGAFDETHRAEMARSADRFMEMQGQFEELAALEAAVLKAEADVAAADKKEDAGKTLSEAQQKLREGRTRLDNLLATLADAREPYAELGKVYRGALALRGNDFASAQSTLSADRWGSIEDAESSQRFIAELEAFTLARAELDQENLRSLARGHLRALAERGAHFDVAAALALASASGTDEEKAEARSVLEQLRSRAPEQTEVIESALAQLQ
jgi:hypothetical protein